MDSLQQSIDPLRQSTNIRNVILSSHNIDTHAVIKFINTHHVQENGNSTLISEDILNMFSKLGTICSYMSDHKDITGVIFSVLLTLNVGKSSYTTYLCVHSDYRKNQHAAELVKSNISFGSTLGVKHGYYLGIKSRRSGCLINSWYRILDIDRMASSGFDMVEDNRKAKLKYRIRVPEGLYVEKGLHVKSIGDVMRSVYWDPDPKELDRYKTNLNWYTIFERETIPDRPWLKPIAIFALTPLDCKIGHTGKTVKIGMLTYYYSFGGYDMHNIKIIFQTAKKAGYECVYGYILGSITPSIVNDSGCHITGTQFYLDFYNHPNTQISADDINIPVF